MSTTPPHAPLPPSPSDPRPTPNYALRRLVAGGAVLVVLVLLVVGATAALGSDSDGGDAAAPTTTVADTTTTVAETTTTTTTNPIAYPRHNDLTDPPTFPARTPPVRSVSETDPLSVWVLGDSTAQALGELFENDVKDVPSVDARTIYKNSSGLTRPDFYDWPAALPSYLAEGAPDVVVLSMGDNDAQPLQPEGSTTYTEVGTPAWTAEYTRRLTAFVAQLTAAGSRVYLVGQPVMRDGSFDGRIAAVDGAYRSVAAADPEITYIDARALLSDDAGGYTDTLPGTDGEAVQVRNSDGIHLSVEGARWLARVVGRQVGADYGIPMP